MATYKVLGIDPGKSVNSFAYSLLEVDEDTLEYKPITSGYLDTTVSSMADSDDFLTFYSELNALMEYLKITKNDVVVSEQYFARGINRKGNSEAYINFMLGVMYVTSFLNNAHYYLYLPSVWKTKFKTVFGEYADTYMASFNGTVEHEADATGLAVYHIVRSKEHLELAIAKEEKNKIREEKRKQREEAKLIQEEKRKQREELRKKKEEEKKK